MSTFVTGSQRPIVAGYNGREHSREALLWAAAEAVRRDAPLGVVPGTGSPSYGPLALPR